MCYKQLVVFRPCVVAMFYCSPKQLEFKKTWRVWLENMTQLNSATFGMGVDAATQHGADKPRGKSNKQTPLSPCSKATWFLALVSTCCQLGKDTGTMAGGMLLYINPKVMQRQFLSCFSWCNALFSLKPSWFCLAEGLTSSDYFFGQM